MLTRGFIPNKCGCCEHLFEGECLRGADVVGRFLHLDFGPCGIPGNTEPVELEDKDTFSKVAIPEKCKACDHLLYAQIYGFTCKKDSSKWGGIYRGLDWGNWHPRVVYFKLPLPKMTTTEMCRCVSEDNLLPFIKEYRRVNPGSSIEEAKKDYALMREKIEGKKNCRKTKHTDL
ncbi:MAG: hypothetical protein GY757_00140 [bacterium]|nr:hypothetical protein [bacterium]